MSFLIPNAGNTTGGNKFTALDQAEPDSVDFSILGNIGRSGVLSGAAVTANNNSTDVAVAAGSVVLSGVPYALASNPSLLLPSAPVADYRFDLVLVRIIGGNATLTVVAGSNSATNPQFPASRQLLTGNYDAAINVDFDTDIVLAAVFRNAGAAVNPANILDKRVLLSSTVKWQGGTVPGAGEGTVGSIFLENPAPEGGVNSGLYVKTSDGWQELVRTPSVGGPFWPVGMVGIWPGKGALPQGYRDAIGEVLPISTYPDLFAAWGTDYGGDGVTTFGSPDYRDLFIRGAAVPTDAGVSVGQDNITLTTANLPIHNHGMQHTHPIPHTHTNNHEHGPHTTSSSGSHSHTSGTLSTDTKGETLTGFEGNHAHASGTLAVGPATSGPAGSHSHGPGTIVVTGNPGQSPMVREMSYGNSYYVTGYTTTGNGIVTTSDGATWGSGMATSFIGQLAVSGSTTGEGNHNHSIPTGSIVGSTDWQGSAHSHTVYSMDLKGATDSTSNHNHSITVGPFSGSTGPVSTASSGASSEANTLNTGSGVQHTNIPSSKKARFVFRAL